LPGDKDQGCGREVAIGRRVDANDGERARGGEPRVGLRAKPALGRNRFAMRTYSCTIRSGAAVSWFLPLAKRRNCHRLGRAERPATHAWCLVHGVCPLGGLIIDNGLSGAHDNSQGKRNGALHGDCTAGPDGVIGPSTKLTVESDGTGTVRWLFEQAACPESCAFDIRVEAIQVSRAARCGTCAETRSEERHANRDCSPRRADCLQAESR
jgi:hypothetical protein